MVAVKVIELSSAKDGDETTNLEKEIMILNQCKHPNIVGYFGSFKDDEYLYVINLLFILFDLFSFKIHF